MPSWDWALYSDNRREVESRDQGLLSFQSDSHIEEQAIQNWKGKKTHLKIKQKHIGAWKFEVKANSLITKELI